MTMQDYAFIHLQICDDPDSRLDESQREKAWKIEYKLAKSTGTYAIEI